MSNIQKEPENGGEIFRFVLTSIPTCPDLKTLMKKIYGQYGFPVIVTDISYHLIAYGGPLPCPDEYWNTIISNGTATPDTIIEGYYKDGYMDRLSVEKEPFLVNWGISKDAPQTTCGVTVNGNLDGICSVLYFNDCDSETALTLNAALRDAAEIYLTMRADKFQSSYAPERAFVARIMLEDTGASVQLLENTKYYRNANINPGYVIIAIQLRTPVTGRLQNLRSCLKSRFPSMLYVSNEDGVVCFFSNIDSAGNVRQITEAIDSEAAGKVDHVCGISQIFYSLDNRGAYVEQAKLALQYGMSDKTGLHMYHFSKFYGPIIMQVGMNNIMPENLLLSELKTLINLDKENGTNFYESFKCYLYNKCDMPKAAAQLFLHRNSLMYRIKRAQELMGVDVSEQQEFERFYVCCRIADSMGLAGSGGSRGTQKNT
jgi:hypothetical protein